MCLVVVDMVGCIASAFFFFSSRRRHTRCSRDWSSDVCSSDLFFTTATVFPPTSGLYPRESCGFQRPPLPTNWDPQTLPTWCCWARYSRRSEEHTSELQSRLHLVCRLLLEKKKPGLPPAVLTRQTAHS